LRFVPPKYIAISNFLASFDGIVAALRQELTEDGTTPETKAKINGWLRKTTQFKCVAYLTVMCDVHTAIRVFSTQVHSDSAQVIDVPTYLDGYKASLPKLAVSLGPEA
jgi:hypothetical protein